MFTHTEITGRITRIECPGNVFAYLVQGDERALLIDTGFGYGDLKGEADALTDLPYDLLLTHGHFDHAGGAAQFGTVYLNSRDALVLRDGCDTEMRYGFIRMGDPQAKREDMFDPMDICELHELEDGRVFDLGGLTVEAVAMPGHTMGYMGLLFPEERTFLAGDGLCSATLLNFPYSAPISVYRDALKAVKERCWDRVETVLYSHPHNVGGPQILDEMIELCDGILSSEIRGIPRQEPVGMALLARPFGGEDGRFANLIYTEDSVR